MGPFKNKSLLKLHYNDILSPLFSLKVKKIFFRKHLQRKILLNRSFVSSKNRPFLHPPRCSKTILFLMKNHCFCLCLLLLQRETERDFKMKQFSGQLTASFAWYVRFGVAWHKNYLQRKISLNRSFFSSKNELYLHEPCPKTTFLIYRVY